MSTREYDEDGNRVLHAVSLREAERYKYQGEQQGFDARITRDPLRVVLRPLVSRTQDLDSVEVDCND